MWWRGGPETAFLPHPSGMILSKRSSARHSAALASSHGLGPSVGAAQGPLGHMQAASAREPENQATLPALLSL